MSVRKFLIAAVTGLAFALPLAAAPLGDDGLHKPDWIVETFRDMRDDLEDAQAQGKRLLLMFEQRGCIYCTRMHENVYPDPEITRMLTDDFMVIQINLFGNVPITDFDGTTLDERDMARRWGVVFTPTLIFAPESVPDSGSMRDAAVMTMPGAFERGTTRLMLQWVLEKGYESEEHFQHYVARMLSERAN